MNNLFEEEEYLNCACCGKKLEKNGIVVIIEAYDPETPSATRDIKEVYTSCKGNCDERLLSQKRTRNTTDGWKDLDDLKIPILYLQWAMAIMNGLKDGDKYTDEAFNSLKNILIILAQDVFRNMKPEEISRAETLSLIPF